MAYEVRNLSVLAYANGFTLWHYKTKDDLESIINGFRGDENYFGGDPMVRSGDIIVANVRVDQLGKCGGAATFLVESNNGTSVKIKMMTSTDDEIDGNG